MVNVLVITKGHPFEKQPFFDIFDAMADVQWTHVEQPAAQAVLAPLYVDQYDALVFYDMPGIEFGESGPQYAAPADTLKSHFEALTQAGKGLVFLHHAIAGWPAWPEYADLLGGRFCYTPQTLRGTDRQDSGYRHHVDHEITVVAEHPVTAGVPSQFSMTDELYLFEVFAEDITPLLTSNYGFVENNFYSASKAVLEGKMYDNEDWHHEPGSNLVGWTRRQDNSQLVYLQGGDDPQAYGNPHYRQLIHNAINWVAQSGAG